MSTLSLSRFSAGCHPAVRPGLDALAAFLADEGYSSHSTGRIIDHVAREGTLGGLVESGYLEPADEAAAEDIYVRNLQPMPQCGRDWQDESIYLDVDSLQAAWVIRQVILDAAERVDRSVALRDPDGSIRLDVDEVLLAAMDDRPY